MVIKYPTNLSPMYYNAIRVIRIKKHNIVTMLEAFIYTFVAHAYVIAILKTK